MPLRIPVSANLALHTRGGSVHTNTRPIGLTPGQRYLGVEKLQCSRQATEAVAANKGPPGVAADIISLPNERYYFLRKEMQDVVALQIMLSNLLIRVRDAYYDNRRNSTIRDEIF